LKVLPVADESLRRLATIFPRAVESAWIIAQTTLIVAVAPGAANERITVTWSRRPRIKTSGFLSPQRDALKGQQTTPRHAAVRKVPSMRVAIRVIPGLAGFGMG